MANEPHLGTHTLDPGEVVMGRYVVEKQIAEGGMAAIHRTHDRLTGRRVALKVLYPYYSQNPVVCTRFLDEGRIQRYLEHPNIIDVFEIVEQPPLAIIMEYIEGPTLEEYLEEHGPLSVPELLSLMLPVLSAMGFAHQKGIIHRDLKPSNILLEKTASGLVPKVMDFGVAKVSRSHDLTADGTTVGTLHYMSPEQIVGSRHIDGRADIYSLGVTIYKLCTGEVPFNASTEFALMMAQVEAAPTPPSQLQPGISRRLEEIILQALAKKPEGRFQSVRELTSALLELKKDDAGEDDAETLTAPLPAELLRYAMMADEVAIDRTGELNITVINSLLGRAGSADDTDTRELLASESGSVAEDTVQIDRGRLKAKMLEDRAAGKNAGKNKDRPLSQEDLLRAHIEELGNKHTRPMERETTRQIDAPDSRALTRPFDKPASLVEQDGRATSTPEARAPESVPVQRAQSAPTPIPEDRPGAAARAMPHMSDVAELADSGTPLEPRLAPVQRDAGSSPGRIELRARAAGEHSLTDISRDEVQSEFRRMTEAEKSGESQQNRHVSVLIGIILAVSVALLFAIIWRLL